MRPRYVRALLIVAALCFLIVLFASPVSAEPTALANTTDGEQQTVAVTYDVDLPDANADRIQLTIAADDLANEELRFSLRGSDIDVIESNGFTVEGSTLTTNATDAATITVAYDPSEQFVSPVRDDFTATSDWALFRVLLHAPDGVTVEESVEPEGIRGSSFIYVGGYETYERSVADDTISLIVPDHAEVQDAPDAIADTIAESSRYLRIGARADHTQAFVGPAELRQGGIVGQDGEFWAHEALDIGWNTWTHEYVHHRQDRHHFTDAQWLVEAEARYYQHLVAYKQGNLTYHGQDGFDAFSLQLASYGSQQDVQLDDPTTWGSNANYEKGARVLAALDVDIRERTDGERDYRHVMHRLNQRDHVTANTLQSETEAVVGESMDAFFDAYVSGTAMPSTPDDADLYREWPIDPNATYNVSEAVQTDAPPDVDVPGNPVHAGETVNITYTIDQTGTDPLLAPNVAVDPPAGWTFHDMQVNADWDRISETELAGEDVWSSDPMTITVQLEATDGDAETGVLNATFSDADGTQIEKQTTMTAVRPVRANLSVDEPVHEPNTTVTLDAGESEIPRDLDRYEWDLTGDGEYETSTEEPIVTETFPPGATNVSVRVVNDLGVWDTASVWANATDTPDINVEDHVTTIAGEWFSIPANVSSEYGTVGVVWTLPDGSTATGNPGTFTAGPGEYTLDVAAVDEYGARNNTSVDILSIDRPVIESAVPETLPAETPVTLETEVNKEVGGYNVTWDLPENETQRGETVNTSFSPGAHNITIHVVDEYGLRTNETHTMFASDVPDVSITGPTTAEPDALSSLEVDIENEYGNTTTRWTIAGTSVPGSPNRILRTFDPGTYEITVIVTDEYGIAGTATHELTVPEPTTGEDDAPEPTDETIPAFGVVHAVVGLTGIGVLCRRFARSQ